MSSLRTVLERYPRVNLTRTPTPLHKLEHLSAELGLNFYIKRDDLTDLTLGGDKPRKLEYEIAQALENGADTLITCGSSQSNHARLTTAAARRLGLDCLVVLSRDQWQRLQGNLLTVYLMGADVHLVESADHWDLEAQAMALMAELETQGKKPHYIPISGSTPHSCLGYVRAALEIIDQLDAMDVQIDTVYLPFGTGGIFTSILFAFHDCNIDSRFVGISINRPLAIGLPYIDQWWQALSDLLQRSPAIPRERYRVYEDFIGEEYGDPTQAGLDAIIRMAQLEGILLDPVYTGKVFSGFLAHHQEGHFREDQNILMLHSGGVPALFAYSRVISKHLIGRGLAPESLAE